jgi:Icc-related predicted phosphoesterase
MKIQLVSDIHLEFGPISLDNHGADVLVLSGDICVAADLMDVNNEDVLDRFDRSSTIHTFFQECCARFKHVIFIMGNHEHYHGDFAKTFDKLKQHLGYLVNLHILEKESLIIDDVTFICGTLWTDMNKEDPMTMATIRGVMNDYRIIDDSREPVHYKDVDGKFHTRTGKFSAMGSVVEHKEMLAFINKTIEANPTGKFVVVGHHAPSKLSTKQQYVKEVIMNGAYSSDLSEFILDHPQIKLWTHGHTHSAFDYEIGTTRIVCNPRGYDGHEYDTGFDPAKVIEV